MKRACLALASCLFVLISPVGTAIRGAETALVVDRSGSMAGDKLRAAVEGGKLFTAILPQGDAVRLVAFDGAASSATFRIDSSGGRDQALRWLDKLSARGGTDYLTALQAITESPSAIVFLSDGEHGGSPEAVLELVQRRFVGRTTIHTIAIQTVASSPAEKLLVDMAAATGGTFTRVEQSEQLVKALVGIAIRLGNYRAGSGCP